MKGLTVNFTCAIIFAVLAFGTLFPHDEHLKVEAGDRDFHVKCHVYTDCIPICLKCKMKWCDCLAGWCTSNCTRESENRKLLMEPLI
ncbi:hypothetical protein M9H77_01589 [Catharanthus roseus]|uniref:Uncharacterized protein n=1 Tax=Catharanthus roseus TaxID=4058 RepID=A0ACC0C5X7_CATRO|nr:hypothetical protein M9H77_01589 [Catharanthus roseus]